jgi:histidinol-phosphate aminotransferase
VVDLTRDDSNVVVFRTFAKIYGLAGLSIGYAVAPKQLAKTLKRKGLGAAHGLNWLAVAAAAASLQDADHVDRVRRTVADERDAWHALLDKLGRRHADSRGNFVFFETGRPHDVVAAQLGDEGIEIARAFPRFGRWVRITIGLPGENTKAREAVAKLLG